MRCLIIICACRSPIVAAGLGWSGQPTGSIIAAQLAAIGQANITVRDEATSQSLAAAVPTVYRALLALDEHEMEVAHALLAPVACIWTGRGFVPAAKVALRCVTCFCLRKLLWVSLISSCKVCKPCTMEQHISQDAQLWLGFHLNCKKPALIWVTNMV